MDDLLWFSTGALTTASLALFVMYAQGLMSPSLTRSQRVLAGVGAFGFLLVAAVQVAEGRWPFGASVAAVAGAYGIWAAAPRLPHRHRVDGEGPVNLKSISHFSD